MLEATCSLFSVPLGADEKEVGEESEEERIWNLLKEENQREEKRQSEQTTLEKEQRELEKLDQERVITRAQFSMLVSAWYTFSCESLVPPKDIVVGNFQKACRPAFPTGPENTPGKGLNSALL